MWKSSRFPSLLTATLVGFISSAGQVLIIRELLVLLYGNEISTGVLFAAWLLWVAVGSGFAALLNRCLPASDSVLPCGLLVLSFLLPFTVLFIRASRIIWCIPVGEVVSPAAMLGISFSTSFLFCTASGFLFGLAWSRYRGECGDAARQPVWIYLGEAAGAALGGLSFYLLILPFMSAFSGALSVSAVLLCFAVLLEWRGRSEKDGIRYSSVVIAFVAMLFLCAFFYVEKIENLSRQWLWGSSIVTVRDTAYHNLSILRQENQYSFFANGLLLFSYPDPEAAELCAHLPLLEHSQPQNVLLIGGGVSGAAGEILRHPSVNSLDYIEPDAAIIQMARNFLPAPAVRFIQDPRVNIFHLDPVAFSRDADHQYDVVILHLGDPANAEMNRFYTIEFFQRMSELMSHGGIFAFDVSSSPDILGPSQARVLSSIHTTLQSVFPEVLLVPGDSARFLAAKNPGVLTSRASELAARLQERQIELNFVRDYYLFDIFNPLRLDYIRGVLQSYTTNRINRDFSPTCYFNGLILWGAETHSFLEKFLLYISELGRPWFWGGLIGGLFLLLMVFRTGGVRPQSVVALCVAVVGGAQIGLEIMLILGFQILEGVVYKELALIVASFMSGAALGAALFVSLSNWTANLKHSLLLVQMIFSLYILAVIRLLFFLQNDSHDLPIALLFTALALIAGLMGGLHFSLAVQAISGRSVASTRVGAGLYAMDLVGAASAAVVTSLFLLPLYGFADTAWAIALTVFVSALLLARNKVSI